MGTWNGGFEHLYGSSKTESAQREGNVWRVISSQWPTKYGREPLCSFCPPDCIGMTRGANINREAMGRLFADLIILETPHPPCITCIMETTDWVQQLLLYEANSFPLQTLFIKCPLCTQWKLSELCAHHMNWAGLADGWNFYPLLLFAVWVMELITSNCDGWINFRVDIRLRTCNAVKASVASICFHSAPVFPLGLAAEASGKNSKKQFIRTWASPMNAPGSWSTGFGFYPPEAIGDNHGKKPD